MCATFPIQHPPIPQAAEKGAVNYPRNLPDSVEVIAQAKGVSVHEVARETRRNALRLFFQRELGEEGDEGQGQENGPRC